MALLLPWRPPSASNHFRSYKMHLSLNRVPLAPTWSAARGHTDMAVPDKSMLQSLSTDLARALSGYSVFTFPELWS